ncbi:MAG: glycosyltransferase family 4 protein [Chloroflexi bacterium]|nr:glycosyltransferase family 4 protein [Chloroflexota bacterium]
MSVPADRDSKINLLFVTTYVGLGGGETALLTLVEALVKQHPQICPHLLLPRDGQLAARWRDHGWPVHLTRWRGTTIYFIPAMWGRFPITRRIARLIRAQAIRAVHSDYHSLPFVVPAAAQTQIPAVWTCWGWWFRPQPWQRGFFRRPAATFASSWAIKAGFLGDPPFMPPDEIEVLPPGVDTTRFRPEVAAESRDAIRADAGLTPETPLVALIARFQDVKGHDVFQEMARLVAAEIPEARFIVAGENVHGAAADDAYKARILATAHTDPVLRERLIYLGFRADAERVIAAADVVVCSSDFESYGMVNVEAMACARPVVSTRRGGPTETVADGETGFLVDPRDAAGLARHVIALLRDPDLRARMGRAGRARVEARFSAEAMGAQFARALARLGVITLD